MTLSRVPIAELCTAVTSGGTPSRKELSFWAGGTIPWIKTGELSDWKVSQIGECITPLGLEKSSAKIFEAGTILMAMYGDGRTITTLGIVDEPSATNQACCAFITDPEKCSNLYLFYALKYHRHELLKLVVAGAQRNLSTGIIKRFPVVIRPLPEQQRIAAVLSTYDDLIENNRRRIALLEEAARQLYKEWFVRFRFPGHEHVKISDGVPEGWEPLKLGDVLTLQRGFDLPNGDRLEGTVPVYGSTGIVGYHATAKVEAPMIITGRSGSLGQVCFVSVPSWPLNTSLWVRDFKRVSPWYAYFLLSEIGLEKFNGGASVPTLDRKVAHAVDVALPPDSLMVSFDEVAQTSFAMIENLKSQNVELAKARDLLLPRLMSGSLAA